MDWKRLKILAVVPARGGSKGIPGKNLRKVGGLSLVARAAQLAGSIPWVDAAVASTDDDAIAKEAADHGLAVPFLRPEELSGDYASSAATWRHAWLEAEAAFETTFDFSILLEPTSPLRTADDIERTVEAMVEGGHRAAATVSRTPAHFTPHKTLVVGDDGTVGFFLPGGGKYATRQSIPDYYHRNGICYAAMRPTVVENEEIIENDCSAVIIDRFVVNIDE